MKNSYNPGKNCMQLKKWKGDLEWDGKWTKEFLNSHPNMMVDTRFFKEAFKFDFLASIENLESEVSGLMFNGDNFHGH